MGRRRSTGVILCFDRRGFPVGVRVFRIMYDIDPDPKKMGQTPSSEKDGDVMCTQ